jgi:hypothetical protein
MKSENLVLFAKPPLTEVEALVRLLNTEMNLPPENRFELRYDGELYQLRKFDGSLKEVYGGPVSDSVHRNHEKLIDIRNFIYGMITAIRLQKSSMLEARMIAETENKEWENLNEP